MLPAPVIFEHHGFRVVRDDMLEGGTKRRVIQPMVAERPEQEFVYASPAYGYAQLALAVSARETMKRATIFTAKRKRPHPLTLAAKAAGAKIVMVPYGYLSNVQSKARSYAERVGALCVPFGVDTEESVKAIAAEAARLQIDEPAEVWCVSGSGTLTRGLQEAWPNAEHHAVAIGANPNTGKAIRHVAPEKFEQNAKLKPPWPSSPNYDAKLWQFVKKIARPGALIWNVGD